MLAFNSFRKNTAFNHTRRYISNWSSYEYNCLFHLTKCFTPSLADFASYFPRYCSVVKWKFQVKLSVIINTFTAVVFQTTFRLGGTGQQCSVAILIQWPYCISPRIYRYDTIPVLISMFIPRCTCIFERFIKYIAI